MRIHLGGASSSRRVTSTPGRIDGDFTLRRLSTRRGTSRWVPRYTAISRRFYDYPSVKPHADRFNPFFTSSTSTTPRPLYDLTLIHPWHFQVSRVSWGVPRLHYTELVLRTTHTDCLLAGRVRGVLNVYRVTLPMFPLCVWSCLSLVWNRCVCGVMGHTPLMHLSRVPEPS